METSSTAPAAKISMIGIWIETVLYGVNFVLYGLCMFILLRGGRVPTLRWMILVTCTTLFLLCTVHVGVSVQQLLDAFVYAPAGKPSYTMTYWLDYTNTLSVLKNYLYGTLVLVQDSILIWRLYVVFMCDWKVVVFPIILAAGCVGSAYAATAVSALPNDGLHGSATSSLIILAWVLGFILSLFVTGSIVARLWRMGRKMASLTFNSRHSFASTIYVVIESGAIFSVTNIVILALYASNSPLAVTGLGIASQLAALTPLLIVVQVGLTNRYHISSRELSKLVFASQDEIALEMGVPGEED